VGTTGVIPSVERESWKRLSMARVQILRDQDHEKGKNFKSLRIKKRCPGKAYAGVRTKALVGANFDPAVSKRSDKAKA